MLRITMQSQDRVLVFVLEGRLVGPWVKELECCWRSAAGTQQGYPMRVDLSAVTFIDADGKVLLGQMYREGAELVASGCLNKCIVEEIRSASSRKAAVSR
jgi:anti-anti-sigma regulatory factor